MLLSKYTRHLVRRAADARSQRRGTCPPRLAEKKSPKRLLPSYSKLIKEREGLLIKTERLALLHGCPLFDPSKILIDIHKRNSVLTKDELLFVTRLDHPHRRAVLNTLKVINTVSGITDRATLSTLAYPLLVTMINDPLTPRHTKRKLRDKWLFGMDKLKFNLITLFNTDKRKSHEEAMKLVLYFPFEREIWKILLEQAKSIAFLKNIHSAYLRANSLQSFSGDHVDVHETLFKMAPRLVGEKELEAFGGISWFSDIRMMEPEDDGTRKVVCSYMRYMGRHINNVSEVLYWYPSCSEVLLCCSYSLSRESLVRSGAVLSWLQSHQSFTNGDFAARLQQAAFPVEGGTRSCCESMESLEKDLSDMFDTHGYTSCVIPDVDGCLAILREFTFDSNRLVLVTFSVMREMKLRHPAAHATFMKLVATEMLAVQMIHLAEEVMLRETALGLELGIVAVPLWMKAFTISVRSQFVRTPSADRAESQLSFFSVIELLWFVTEFLRSREVSTYSLVSPTFERAISKIPVASATLDTELSVLNVVHFDEGVKIHSKSRKKDLGYQARITEIKQARRSEEYLYRQNTSLFNQQPYSAGVTQQDGYPAEETDGSEEWNEMFQNHQSEENWNQQYEQYDNGEHSKYEQITHNIERAVDEEDDDDSWYETVD
eukprot:TRINITY_DN19040_c0_g1_i1.p1 TRINITY_DN19040_c0_g1~~TRINITY_DN19040_c0_g1_i1.p1  ORF type:complete len:659 (+),score=88.07 TRINITY_DN19040_c0_g1_i1:157-2133(+)